MSVCCAELAQLARASPCHGEGCEFDSRIPLFSQKTKLINIHLIVWTIIATYKFDVFCQGSSVVEQGPEKPCVGSPILPLGTI